MKVHRRLYVISISVLTIIVVIYLLQDTVHVRLTSLSALTSSSLVKTLSWVTSSSAVVTSSAVGVKSKYDADSKRQPRVVPTGNQTAAGRKQGSRAKSRKSKSSSSQAHPGRHPGRHPGGVTTIGRAASSQKQKRRQSGRPRNENQTKTDVKQENKTDVRKPPKPDRKPEGRSVIRKSNTSSNQTGHQKHDSRAINGSAVSPSGGCPRPRVPSLVHLVWVTRNRSGEAMRLHHLISVLSVMSNIRPRELRFYYDVLPRGRYWKMALANMTALPDVKFRLIHVEPPKKIFGKTIKVNEHGSDVIRLDLIRRYGGIYLDLDIIVTSNLTSLMCYDFVIGEEVAGCCAPNAFMMAVPGSEFGRLWWESYRHFNADHWSWNSVYVPYTLAQKHPDIVHVEPKRMMHPNWEGNEIKYIYGDGLLFDWRNNYVLHLWYRLYGRVHTELTIKRLNTTMGQMFRFFYYGTADFID